MSVSLSFVVLKDRGVFRNINTMKSDEPLSHSKKIRALSAQRLSPMGVCFSASIKDIQMSGAGSFDNAKDTKKRREALLPYVWERK
jgi:hypothetical protein